MEGIAHLDGTHSEECRFRQAGDDESAFRRDDAHSGEAGGRRCATDTTCDRARCDKCTVDDSHGTEAVRGSLEVTCEIVVGTIEGYRFPERALPRFYFR